VRGACDVELSEVHHWHVVCRSMIEIWWWQSGLVKSVRVTCLVGCGCGVGVLACGFCAFLLQSDRVFDGKQ
jgi:hypothetical protein